MNEDVGIRINAGIPALVARFFAMMRSSRSLVLSIWGKANRIARQSNVVDGNARMDTLMSLMSLTGDDRPAITSGATPSGATP
jgi:hypothetical protein